MQHPDAATASVPSPPHTRPSPPPPADDWALFLDVDGCLLEFAPRPDAVVVPPGLPERLVALRQRLDGALALVSGRGIATLDALFAPQRFHAAGLHGVERRTPDGIVAAAAAPDALADVHAAASRLVAAHPGTLIEDKGAALALHWRGAPAAEPALRAFAEQALPALPGYQLQPGDHVLELRPRHADKGSAILAFLDETPFAGRRPVFAGDDLTDEHGFAAVNARDGLSILVGDRAGSAARFGLRNPAAVRRWLASTPGD
ncbi:trehalose-phosphatase [Luteimonas sp. BDR2-5]|uniref:trehalose-phosphatase n=1 Tax=Proluteimonas luteida TaxID=2878685 RepID=UPI001E5BDFBF|nr:trehalose-phosphatase [Luteimonas sp. BDR2-5]MCD9027012.1 trehalose-phosphatase [Luteimonas sp. BDR2-5]